MEIMSRIADLIVRSETFCLATVVVSPMPDVPAGSKMIVFPNGTTEGSIGSPRRNAELCLLAQETLTQRKKRTVLIEGGIRVFLDIFAEDMRLLVCGAGHIALPLTRFAREMGFNVTVLDDRSDFAHPARFPGCKVEVGDFASLLHTMPMGPVTYVVIITRGHEHDVECLLQILPKETAYVGLIGSRRRVHFVLEILRQKGLPPERVSEVFSPIGLPIGAESPEEIALTIVAELVCVRRKGTAQARLLRAAAQG